jgi:signal transduction histidine kinase/CheY-like chemotaxis protein
LSDSSRFAAKRNFRQGLEGIVERSGKSLFVFFLIGATLFTALMAAIRYSEFQNYSERALEDSRTQSRALLTVMSGNIDDVLQEVITAVSHIADDISSGGKTNIAESIEVTSRGLDKAISLVFMTPDGVVGNATVHDDVGKPYHIRSLVGEVLSAKSNTIAVSAQGTCATCKQSHFILAAKRITDPYGKLLGVLVGQVDPTKISNISEALGDAFGGAGLVIFNDGTTMSLDRTKIANYIEKSGRLLIDPSTADRSGKTIAIPTKDDDRFLVSYRYLKSPGIFLVNALDKASALGPWDDILMRTVYAGLITGGAFAIPAAFFALFLFASAEGQARTRRREEELDYVRKAAKIEWVNWLRDTDALEMNAGSAQLLGLEQSDLYSFTNFLDRFEDDEAAALRSAFEDCSRTGTGHRLEITAKRNPATGVRSTLAVTTFRRGSHGNVFAVCQDLSEWQEMRSHFTHLMKMEAVGQLTGGVAHDFNNLLVVILGNIEEICADMPKTDPRYFLLDTALGACMRARELTKQLLAFARKQPLQPSSVDVSALVDGMASLLKRTIGENIKIGLIADKTEKPWKVMADRSQIETAIMNLVINSRDALPNGGDITIIIQNKRFDAKDVINLDGLRVGDYVDIAIEDNGCGMPWDVTSRAIEPYFTTKSLGAGSGLGLSQVYGFAKQSGGHVAIYSEETRGTLVHIYLPRAKSSHYPEVELDPMENGFEFGNETILVVEDEEMVRDHIQRVLGGLGYKVITRTDARSAMKVVDEGVKFDLLLTDVVIPGGVDGAALAARVRKKYPKIPVVYVSGYASGIPEKGALAPDVSFLQKPFLRSELAGKVRKALDKVMAA